MHTRLAIAILVVIAPLQLMAQEASSPRPEPLRLGFSAGYAVNIHSASFSSLAGSTGCCPRYESGDGGGIALGGFLRLPLTDGVHLNLALTYASLDGVLTVQEQTLILDSASVPQTATIEHRFDAAVSSLGLEPSVGMRLFSGLTLDLGMRLDLLLQHHAIETETTDQGVFLSTGTREQTVFDGDIPNTSTLNAALLGSLSWSLPLDARSATLLEPSVTVTQQFTDLLKDLRWKVLSVCVGVRVVVTL